MTKPLNLRSAEAECYRETSGQGWPLGTRMYTPSGRIFRRARAGTTALTVGKLMRKPEREIVHANLAVAAAVAVGGRTITLTLTSIATTFDEYAEGLIYINDAAGQGYVYEIIGNSATAKAGTATVNLSSSSGVEIALTTSSEASLIKNRYNAVTLTETRTNETSVGLTPCAVTASYYFWLQVGGPGAVLQDGTGYDNYTVVPSTNVKGAGMLAINNVSTETVVPDAEYTARLISGPTVEGIPSSNAVGYYIDPRVDTEYSLINVTLEAS